MQAGHIYLEPQHISDCNSTKEDGLLNGQAHSVMLLILIAVFGTNPPRRHSAPTTDTVCKLSCHEESTKKNLVEKLGATQRAVTYQLIRHKEYYRMNKRAEFIPSGQHMTKADSIQKSFKGRLWAVQKRTLSPIGQPVSGGRGFP
ncbi:hypothetical protein DICVIV_05033 [Dictyocaulus viviparus]|uniref:Uncharacterized protein n=1 Tax=Dictyocaulus viviparus TaxID=29172 RepID=A0A0D8XW36_DICVI|nr:hypothetical protein DICVIV_05033 [Dictyocaulus viviparus]